ncbi:type III secretion inner membrane ring lipoprotein SctJ [Proteus vulgaris]|uniref:type III secretion system inner membrane ring lipoprotein SctJ n=1 Tax=Proteus vulgaris TaxID=585 RepID=UPI0018E40155|nr:type III secretion inner membrane ring lipoprotein SctJ [Proteus vulgaris]MBI6528194.1 type III secretion inner membrane ring lipoprotein SctJ [Proteus vulgaris]
MRAKSLLCALLFCLFPLLSGCKDQSLLTGLNQRQTTQVQAVLQKHHITTTQIALGKGLFDITVKKEDFAIAVQILEQYQLPTNARIEVTQIFPSDALVSSPQAEKARLISALEQRLEQSLITIDHIIDARVHISYPLSLSERGISAPHASALIFYEENTLDGDQLSEDVRAFINNAFSDMSINNITVLLYSRNINKLTKPNIVIPDEDHSIFFQYGWLIALVSISIIIIAVLVLIKYRREKTILREEKQNHAHSSAI